MPQLQPLTRSLNHSRSPIPTLICCTGFDDPSWRWYVDELLPNSINWKFIYGDRPNWLEQRIKRPDLLRIRLGWQVIQLAKRERAEMLFTYDTEMAFWCGFFAQLLGVKVKLMAFSFNFPTAPQGLRRWLMRYAFRDIERVVVSSTFECELYHQHYKIPRDRFDFQYWRLAPPNPPADLPIPSGDYICAMGTHARDNGTLLKAMAQLPAIKLVLVARPEKDSWVHHSP